MTKTEKRIEIAKDVIAKLKNLDIYARRGDYVFGLIDYTNCELPTGQIQAYLKDRQICEACALGSLFVSLVLKENEITFNELRDSNAIIGGQVLGKKIRSYLEKYFSLKQLVMIECAFEGWGKDSCELPTCIKFVLEQGELEKCYSFYLNYDSPNSILLAIMQNIIDNKGIFIP